jgi:hypothetical protein
MPSGGALATKLCPDEREETGRIAPRYAFETAWPDCFAFGPYGEFEVMTIIFNGRGTTKGGYS